MAAPKLAPQAQLGAAASAALDQIDRPTRADEAYDHYLHQLHMLDGEVREGRLTMEDMPARRTAILAEMRDAVLHTQPDPVLSRLGDLWRGLDIALDVAAAGATFRDAEAVVDGVVVSGRAWPDHPAWMREFLRILRDKAPA